MKDLLPWLPVILTAGTMAMGWQRLQSAIDGIDKSVEKLNTDAKKIPEIETTQKLQAQDHAHTRHTLTEHKRETTEHKRETTEEFVRLEQLTRERTHRLGNSVQSIENRITGIDARVKALEDQKPLLRAIRSLEETMVRRTTFVATEKK